MVDMFFWDLDFFGEKIKEHRILAFLLFQDFKTLILKGNLPTFSPGGLCPLSPPPPRSQVRSALTLFSKI